MTTKDLIEIFGQCIVTFEHADINGFTYVGKYEDNQIIIKFNFKQTSKKTFTYKETVQKLYDLFHDEIFEVNFL